MGSTASDPGSIDHAPARVSTLANREDRGEERMDLLDAPGPQRGTPSHTRAAS